MQKALREAKVHTTWTEPNEVYETAVRHFVACILDRGLSGEFLADFEIFAARVSHWGMLNSLSETLLRFTAPGVPDTYQGTELWISAWLTLTTAGPWIFILRRRMLDRLNGQTLAAAGDRGKLVRELLGNWQDGRVKMFVTHSA